MLLLLFFALSITITIMCVCVLLLVIFLLLFFSTRVCCLFLLFCLKTTHAKLDILFCCFFSHFFLDLFHHSNKVTEIVWIFTSFVCFYCLKSGKCIIISVCLFSQNLDPLPSLFLLRQSHLPKFAFSLSLSLSLFCLVPNWTHKNGFFLVF